MSRDEPKSGKASRKLATKSPEGATEPASTQPSAPPASEAPPPEAPGKKTTRVVRPGTGVQKGPGTGAQKAPKTGKVTQRQRRIAAPPQDEAELEQITPFKRGLSISFKFAAFTAAVVGLFMGLQGVLTYSIAERELDAQITEQGRSVANTLEKVIDRGLWYVKEAPPRDEKDPSVDEPPAMSVRSREDVRDDWDLRLAELGQSMSGVIQISVIEIHPDKAAQNAIATWPRDQVRFAEAGARPVPDAEGKVVERIVDGFRTSENGVRERVRRFDRLIKLGFDKEREIDRQLQELGRLWDADADEKAQAPVVAKLTELTGQKLVTWDEWSKWREKNPLPAPRDEWQKDGTPPPWVSVFVQAKRLDELKSELWKRIVLVTVCGALAGIILTVLIVTLLTGPIRELEQDVTVVAQGNLGHQTRVKATDEIGALAHVLNIMIRNLRTAQDNAITRKSFERELGIAKEIQEKLLPERIPAIPGYDIHSHYNAAKEVGGDYYDFIVIDQTHLGIIVADVAGKGIPGAMVMTMARSLVRLASVRNVSPADTFKKVNRILAKDIRRGMFVTSAYMVLNVKTRTLKVASAGHNPVVLYRSASKEIELLKPAGIALGFDKGTVFDNNIKEVEVQLEPGDRIVTYTDGVNEAMNNASEEFGDERFFGVIKQHATKTSKECVDAIVKALESHRGGAEQSDDITITTLSVLPGAGGGTTGGGEDA